jgi:glycosyltransferase involved in cell wall biosynthesis
MRLKKKVNLLFDASVLYANVNSKTDGRSGIYWVAYNVLKQFAKCHLYNITLFFTVESFSPEELKKKLKSGHLLLSFPYLSFNYIKYQRHNFRKNIENYKTHIKKTKNIFTIFNRLLKIIKNYIKLAYYFYLNKYFLKVLYNTKVFFSPVFTIPDIIKEISSIKVFHFLHDCIPVLEDIPYPLMDPDHFFKKITEELNKKTFYFCNSECTKKDFLKIFPDQLNEKNMFVTPIATSQTFFPKSDKTALQQVFLKYGIEQNTNDCYIFSLCNIDPRKNLFFTIQCFDKFINKHQINNMYFFLGGGHFDEYKDQFKRKFSDIEDSNDKIKHLGYIDDEDVNILYSNSLFFVYLSQYEGFGMPPLEAMQAGTPVICSNNSSLPEVVGNAAITITYNDEAACIKAFEDYYFNENLRKEYITKGIERAKLFSWEKTAKLMIDKILEII